MRTPLILTYTAAACLFGLPAAANNPPRARVNAESGINLTIVVSQSGSVPQQVREVAQRTVSVLFHRIGIEIRYTNDPSQTNPDAIALHICEHAPKRFGPLVLGSAWLGNGRSREANAYYDRVALFSTTSNEREIGILFGYAIAHELGHVLLAQAGHSADGIMKSSWTRTDARFMLIGIASFTRAEADRMVDGLEARRLVATSGVQ